MKKALVLNGPNLNLRCTREPAQHGYDTLADLERIYKEEGDKFGAGSNADSRTPSAT